RILSAATGGNPRPSHCVISALLLATLAGCPHHHKRPGPQPALHMVQTIAEESLALDNDFIVQYLP
ncbi:MAG: hypothetical protein ACRDS0_27455, partial [Pseudonocardiaceae bacterium]